MAFGLKRGLAPLIRLRDEVRARSATSLEPFAPDAVPSEIRPLIGAINIRMARVRAQMAAQHRFVANSAHQLRTPLPGTEASGSGLGLAIVEEAAEATGGSVRASSPTRGGLGLTVRLPSKG